MVRGRPRLIPGRPVLCRSGPSSPVQEQTHRGNHARFDERRAQPRLGCATPLPTTSASSRSWRHSFIPSRSPRKRLSELLQAHLYRRQCTFPMSTSVMPLESWANGMRAG